MTMRSAVHRRTSARVGYVAAVIGCLVTMLGCSGLSVNGSTPAPFLLSYVDNNDELRMRWSENGVNWAASTGGTPPMGSAPGLASNDRVTYLALFGDGVVKARYMMGIGPASWDTFPSTVGNGHTGEIDSGTSLAHVEGNMWIAAFRSSNQAKLFMFDSGQVRDFTAEVTPVSGTTNNNLDDKPGLANMNGLVLTSWLMTGGRLQMVKGTIENGEPEWDSPYRFDQTVVENGFGDPVGAHDIATDGERLYAAVVRQRDPLPGESLQHYFLFIYTSTNGLNWTRLSSHEVRRPLSLSMAARGEDDVFAILSAPANQFDNEKGFRFDGTDWSLIDDGQIFGGVPMKGGFDFTLFAPR